jgi:L-alanine-DL-glutamate epimerase-like enolase superfamily enzyme
VKIVDIQATPLSFPVPKEKRVTLGIGQAVKRDTVLVKVTTESGLVGWGEAHAGRAPGSIANLINTTLKTLVMGYDATDTVGVWDRVYKMQLASHGMGAAAALALSGVDQALWDIRGKAVGWPVWRLLGGSDKPIDAYAGGVSLGYQPAEQLAEEAAAVIGEGYHALKLRIGDNPRDDIARVRAVRKALGDDVDILVDGNAAQSLDDVRSVMPVLDDAAVGWLEEPFPPHDHRRYAEARSYGRTPLAAGENHYTRFEFHRLIEDGCITILQPDVSKTGGLTEALRIAALAGAWKLRINPHTSATGLNVAASIHLLASIDNAGYFEADLARHNPFRDELCDWRAEVSSDGTVRPPERPGLGVEINEDAMKSLPLIDGPGYV